MSAQDQRKTGRFRALRGVMRSGQGVLARVSESSRRIGRQQRQLQRALPPELRGQWQLASLDGRELALIASSPIWATQLRYRQGDLLQAAAECLGERPARCRITVEPPRLSRRPPSRPPLSAANARLLEDTAASCDNPRLAASLRRLASRRGGPDRS